MATRTAGDGNGPLDFYWTIPPVTRTHATAVILSTIVERFGILAYPQFSLLWRSVFKFELWRLITTFTFLGPFSFNWLFEFIWLIQYGKALESVTHQFDPADHVFMYLFGMLTMLATSLAFNLYLFASPLVFMLLYVWSREFPTSQVSIFGLVTVQSFYLPFVFLAMSVLKGNSWIGDVVGLATGHLWFFLRSIYPRQGGHQVLLTPLWLRRVVANWGIGQVRQPEVNVNPAAPGFRPFTGRGRRL